MQTELVPVRRAQELMQSGTPTDEVVDALRLQFGLDFVGAIAAVAAGALVSGRSVANPAQPFVRPYVERLGGLGE